MLTRLCSPRWRLSCVALGALLILASCKDKSNSEPAPASQVTSSKPPDASARDAARVSAPKRVFAKDFVVHVRAGASRTSDKLGYLRAGATTRTKRGEAAGHDRCRAGWYEIEQGGYVCNVADVTLFDGEKLPDWRTVQPDLEANLPYKFAYSRRNGIAVFAKMPSAEQRDFYERGGIVDAGVPEAGVDGGLAHKKERASLEALAEGTDRVLKRRMNRGFFVSLDREVEYGKHTYWRTQHHEYIPKESLGEIEGSTFVGVQLAQDGSAQDAATPTSLPVVFVWGNDVRGTYARNLGDDNFPSKLRTTSAPIKLEHRAALAFEEVQRVGKREYVIANELQIPMKQVIVVDGVERPAKVPAGSKWIAVNLSNQSLVAYEGDTPVYVTLVSTGRVRSRKNETRNHPTPTGVFRISSKHVSHMMDGDSAIDGPYSIEDVPYVMYFQGAFAFHAAFWHNRFGRPKSHGCVNLAPKDAKHLFSWADPELPANWHGVYGEERGTWVYIYGETPIH